MSSLLNLIQWKSAFPGDFSRAVGEEDRTSGRGKAGGNKVRPYPEGSPHSPASWPNKINVQFKAIISFIQKNKYFTLSQQSISNHIKHRGEIQSLWKLWTRVAKSHVPDNGGEVSTDSSCLVIQRHLSPQVELPTDFRGENTHTLSLSHSILKSERHMKWTIRYMAHSLIKTSPIPPPRKVENFNQVKD